MEQRCGDKRCGLQRGPIWSLIKLQACQPLVNPYVSEFTLEPSPDRQYSMPRIAVIPC